MRLVSLAARVYAGAKFPPVADAEAVGFRRVAEAELESGFDARTVQAALLRSSAIVSTAF